MGFLKLLKTMEINLNPLRQTLDQYRLHLIFLIFSEFEGLMWYICGLYCSFLILFSKIFNSALPHEDRSIKYREV